MAQQNTKMDVEVNGQKFTIESKIDLVRQNADFIQGGTSYWTTDRNTLETTLNSVLQQAADTFAVLAFLDEEEQLEAAQESNMKASIVSELEAKNALPKNDPTAVQAIVDYISANFKLKPVIPAAPAEPEEENFDPEAEEGETVDGETVETD